MLRNLRGFMLQGLISEGPYLNFPIQTEISHITLYMSLMCSSKPNYTETKIEMLIQTYLCIKLNSPSAQIHLSIFIQQHSADSQSYLNKFRSKAGGVCFNTLLNDLLISFCKHLLNQEGPGNQIHTHTLRLYKS